MGKHRTVRYYKVAAPQATTPELGGIRIPEGTQAALRNATACAREIEAAAQGLETAASHLADAVDKIEAVKSRALAAVSGRRTAAGATGGPTADPGAGSGAPSGIALVAPANTAHAGPSRRSVDAPAHTLAPGLTDVMQELVDAGRLVLRPSATAAPAPARTMGHDTARGMRAALDETTRLNAMYIAFIDTAAGRLDVLEQALREQPDKPLDAVVEAYPPHLCKLFKANRERLKRCKTSALVYRSMIATDRRSLIAAREYLVETTKPLATLMPRVQDHALPKMIRDVWVRLNEFMQFAQRDILCENMLAYWCADMQRESRRLLPVIVNLQLDALAPYVSAAERQARQFLPNLDHFVEAAAQPRRLTRRSTLAMRIARDGPQMLEHLQRRTAAAALLPPSRAAAGSGAQARTTSSDAAADASDALSESSLSDSGSESEEEDLYARRAQPQARPMPRREAERKPRRLRFEKQSAPDTLPRHGAGDAATAAGGASDAGACSGLGRHKAKHRAGKPAAAAGTPIAAGTVVDGGMQGDTPAIKLGKRAADTFRRLMAPSYIEKVKRDEYLHLLNDFAARNGPQGTGYLKRVRQTSSDAGADTSGAMGPLRFNGSHESIWFQRHDDQWVLHSFHYPHGRESHVELPKGMLHDYRNVFKAFAISAEET